MFLLSSLLLSGVLSFGGRLTYFDPGLGACGGTNSGSDLIVAMNSQQYGGTCGRSVCINYGDESVSATVVDMCPGCPYGALDGSPTVFRGLVGSLGPGVVQVSWNFGSCGSGSNQGGESSTLRVSVSSTLRVSATSTSQKSSQSTDNQSTRISEISSSSSSRTSTSSIARVASNSTSVNIGSSTTTVTLLPLSQRTACYISN